MHGYVTIPAGDFGDALGEEAGLAKTGFGLGTELTLATRVSGLSWASDASILFNGFDLGAFKENAGGVAEVGWWWNVPLLTGLRYDAAASPEASMYGTVLAGLSIAKTPDFKWSGQMFDGYDLHAVDMDQEASFATSLGFELGGGLVIGDDLDISLRYLNLGSPEFHVHTELTTDGQTEARRIMTKKPISMFLISAGLKF
jgi:hypothetical protein